MKYLAFLFFICTSYLIADIQIFDPTYKSELFARYQTGGFTSNMTFDSSGNMYVANRDDGKVSKVDPAGNVTLNWSSGYGYVADISETSGTVYGTGFVVSDRNAGTLYKVDNNGNKTPFASLSQPMALALDTNGTYTGSLFGISATNNRVYKISSSGQSSLFCNNFYGASCDLLGLNFDPGTRYGGKMYLGVWGPTGAGIYSVNTSGNATKFSSGIVSAGALEFDHPNGLFGGDMFALARQGSHEGIYELYRIGVNGTSTRFINDSNPALGVGAFTFGPDGALYAAVKDTGTQYVNIYRITPVPEPSSISLLCIGLYYCIRKKRTI